MLDATLDVKRTMKWCNGFHVPNTVPLVFLVVTTGTAVSRTFASCNYNVLLLVSLWQKTGRQLVGNWQTTGRQAASQPSTVGSNLSAPV